jgi:hypothetical protein
MSVVYHGLLLKLAAAVQLLMRVLASTHTPLTEHLPPFVQGVVTGDAFCLELDTGTWQRLPPAPLGAGSGAPSGGPRFAHCAVALPREHGGGALVIGARCKDLARGSRPRHAAPALYKHRA